MVTELPLEALSPAAGSCLATTPVSLVLEYVEETTYSNTSETGVVAKQEPAAGDKASKGSSVTIWVSQGAEKVAVPGRRAAAWSRAPSSRSTRPSARRSPRGRLSCCRSRNRPKLSAQLRVARGAAGRAAPPAQFAK